MPTSATPTGWCIMRSLDEILDELERVGGCTVARTTACAVAGGIGAYPDRPVGPAHRYIRVTYHHARQYVEADGTPGDWRYHLAIEPTTEDLRGLLDELRAAARSADVCCRIDCDQMIGLPVWEYTSINARWYHPPSGGRQRHEKGAE